MREEGGVGGIPVSNATSPHRVCLLFSCVVIVIGSSLTVHCCTAVDTDLFAPRQFSFPSPQMIAFVAAKQKLKITTPECKHELRSLIREAAQRTKPVLPAN